MQFLTDKRKIFEGILKSCCFCCCCLIKFLFSKFTQLLHCVECEIILYYTTTSKEAKTKSNSKPSSIIYLKI